MNNLTLDSLNSTSTYFGTLNVSSGTYLHGTVQLEPSTEINFGYAGAKIYVKEGRLYFSSPEIGEWALTPTKEEKVKRILNNVDDNT